MTKKLLHVLRCCAVGQQIAGEGVAKLMEMKALHTVHSFLCYLTHIGNRCRRLIPAIPPHTDKADRLIALWRMLLNRQAVDLIVGAVLFLNAQVVILAV